VLHSSDNEGPLSKNSAAWSRTTCDHVLGRWSPFLRLLKACRLVSASILSNPQFVSKAPTTCRIAKCGHMQGRGCRHRLGRRAWSGSKHAGNTGSRCKGAAASTFSVGPVYCSGGLLHAGGGIATIMLALRVLVLVVLVPVMWHSRGSWPDGRPESPIRPLRRTTCRRFQWQSVVCSSPR